MTAQIRLDDVINFFEYEKVREDRRQRVIALKAKRTKWTAASFPFSSSEWPASKTPGTRRPPAISIHT